MRPLSAWPARAGAVSASDLAAMGARPVAFTLALTLPQVDADWLQAFARGLNHMALGCSLRLIGGDTTRGPLSLTLTVFGAVPAGSALTRSGACAGDLLCVGGALGDGAGALPLVLKQRSAEASIAEALLARYWSPQPQLALGQALRGRATSALDISDGLLADCGHIARASGVRLVVERDRLPMSDQLLTLFDLPSARQAALSGGDDYILAFTLPSGHLASLLDEGWPVHVIGRVEKGQGVVVVDGAGLDVTPDTRGYQHFDSAQ
ncbi:Thiamine-monophosphate kinase [Pseudomonas amygdali pv. eriobotryae]|uniref:Thiamine-monophosphate kinase n=1 Tax=Pseudomonas amygdali pv. eriobotryae TaxID=129137 RepID=A0A3M3W738_PSEA0|nr:Thiamine-monophosphate kinase [Pseudomonas amygdali pv. eriobotryae]